MVVMRALVEHGDVPVEATDIRVMITKITGQMLSPNEAERVKKHLGLRGWPSSDEFPAAGSR
jgi:hypothetical protein